MKPITTIEELEAIYGQANPKSIDKVVRQLTPLYQQWINAAKFVILSTVGPEGTDASPRGDIDPVVHIANPKTLWLPDWTGNNRIDSLRNIIRDGRASLMFMVPGCDNVVRSNGTATVSCDKQLCKHFEKNAKLPRSVIVFTIEEAYFQCAKALMRSALWSSNNADPKLPTAGDFLKEFNSTFDGASYDKDYPAYAKPKMW